MTTLAELLSALVTEFTVARVHADLEAARVSEVYRHTPLLEGAPIPRFRLPELTIDLPIGVDDITGGTDALTHRYEAFSEPIGQEGIDRALTLSQIGLTPKQRSTMGRELMKQVKAKWKQPLEIGPALLAVSQMVRHLGEMLRNTQFQRPGAVDSAPPAPVPEELRLMAIAEFQRALQSRLHAATLGRSGVGPRVNVIARTSALREVKDAGLLTRLNLTLREDGFELIKIDRDDGTTAEKFVPE